MCIRQNSNKEKKKVSDRFELYIYRAMAPLRLSRMCSMPWKPQNTRKACEVHLLAHRGPFCRTTTKGGENNTYSIHYHGSENRAGNSLALLGRWVFCATNKLLMAAAVDASQGAQDDNRKRRNNDATRSKWLAMCCFRSSACQRCGDGGV